MTAGSPPPAVDSLQALALDALLDHLNRGEPRHALQQLHAGLERQLAARCVLQALADDGTARWTEGAAPADPAALHGWLSLPLQRLDRMLGHLQVERGPAPADPVWRPLLTTLGALLLADAAGGDGTGGAASAAMIRAALAGAGTFVWEWDVGSDHLGDIDEGLAQLGYAPGEVERTQQGWDSLIHPDDIEANHAAYLEHAAGKTAMYEHAYRARTRDGGWRWLQERGRIVERHPDGTPRRMLGTQTDVTERKAAEQAASRATARLEKIARHAPGMLYQFELAPDGSARFRYVSERVESLFGLGAEQAMRDATAMFDAIVPDDRAAVQASIMASARGLLEWRCEFRVGRAGGPPRWLLGRSTPQRDADGTVVWHGTVQDVTERRELDAARQAAAVAQAANQAKTAFLSRMSHELRTPLNAVLGFAQLMEIDEAEPAGATQRQRLALIRQSGEHLLQMIGDLLDMTRIEAGGMALQIEPIALAPLAGACLAMLQSQAAAAGVRLEQLPPAADLHVRADATRLRQVLLNLLGNAIKYNRRAGQARLCWFAAEDGFVHVQVADDGPGIAAEDLPRLFEPFYRGAQHAAVVDGAGIGLSVTQSLVTLMGGRVMVHSPPGRGAVFTVALPSA
jgi:PAS domain S-box-containing protein